MATKKKTDHGEVVTPMENEATCVPAPEIKQAHPTKIDPASLPNLYPGVEGRRGYVALLQRLLHRPETGVYDTATAQAVQRFQLDSGLPPEAGVTQAMWRKLLG